ncbi:MAG: DNA translocase FtsK, partial [Candidatus Yanofskybacteria bacterium]|nr:DNA translocase FtsK [Candidatus Yanofskybacteria bacterium]
KEVRDVVEFIRKQADKLEMGSGEEELKVDLDSASHGSGGTGDDSGIDDDLYEDAKVVVVSAGKASASLLQRRLRVGYARAARLLDILEEKGIIGPGDGAKPREVYVQHQNPAAQIAVEEQGISADTPEAEREEI